MKQMKNAELFKYVNVQQLTQLGSLVQTYIASNDESLKELVKEKINKEISNDNFNISGPLGERIQQFSIYHFLAEDQAFSFLYKNSNLKQNKMNKIYLTASNRNIPYKKDSYSFTNTPLTSALIHKNLDFINFFKKEIQEVEEEHLMEYSKIAINEGVTEFLDIMPENIINKLKNYKNKLGQNVSYMAYDMNMLEYLKNRLAVEPKSVEEWFSKYTFRKLSATAIVSIHQPFLIKTDSLYLNCIKDMKDKDYSVEYYNIGHKKMAAPAVWTLLVEQKKFLESIEPILDPSVKDSMGNNFLAFYLNNLRKVAPELNDEKTLEILEKLVKSRKYDLFTKNSDGRNVVDMINSIINKDTKSHSVRLDKFKVFCEKISLLSLIEENTQSTKRTLKI